MDHKDLDVWKQAINLVENIYKLTAEFPKSELYGLVSQMRRAAVSIPSNISEGAARSSNKEFLNFLNYSIGSIAELETQLIIAENLKYCTIQNSLDLLARVKALVIGLRNKLKRDIGNK